MAAFEKEFPMKTWLASLCICLVVSCTAVADDAGIHRMVIGDRGLELLDTTRLTTHNDGEVRGAWISPDGRYVAYIAESAEGARLCMVRSSGGRADVLLAADLRDFASSARTQIEMPVLDIPAAWSPDSSVIAFPVRYAVPETGAEPESAGLRLLVMTPAGMRRASFELPKDTWFRFRDRMQWSPDSHRFACPVRVLRSKPGAQPEKRELRSEVFVFDIERMSAQTVLSTVSSAVRLDSWSADGRDLSYCVRSADGMGWQLRVSGLDGKPDVLVREVKSVPQKSPDGVWQVADKPGLSIENSATGEIKEIFKDYYFDVVGWTPDSKMVAYAGACTMKDEPGQRVRELNSVWLAIPEPHKRNHMCAALDHDADAGVSFSNDGMRMAYVCQGRAYVAELGWVALEFDDKLAAGIPLTEDEEKLCLMNNAKQIGTAINMFQNDNEDRYPSGDEFQTAVLDYCRNNSIFCRPGQDVPIFQYFPLGSESEIKDVANTMVGMFDVGYGWQVILYADGHVSVKPK